MDLGLGYDSPRVVADGTLVAVGWPTDVRIYRTDTGDEVVDADTDLWIPFPEDGLGFVFVQQRWSMWQPFLRTSRVLTEEPSLFFGPTPGRLWFKTGDRLRGFALDGTPTGEDLDGISGARIVDGARDRAGVVAAVMRVGPIQILHPFRLGLPEHCGGLGATATALYVSCSLETFVHRLPDGAVTGTIDGSVRVNVHGELELEQDVVRRDGTTVTLCPDGLVLSSSPVFSVCSRSGAQVVVDASGQEVVSGQRADIGGDRGDAWYRDLDGERLLHFADGTERTAVIGDDEDLSRPDNHPRWRADGMAVELLGHRDCPLAGGRCSLVVTPGSTIEVLSPSGREVRSAGGFVGGFFEARHAERLINLATGGEHALKCNGTDLLANGDVLCAAADLVHVDTQDRSTLVAEGSWHAEPTSTSNVVVYEFGADANNYRAVGLWLFQP